MWSKIEGWRKRASLELLCTSILMMFAFTPLFSQVKYAESDYAYYIKSLIGGETEVSVEGGRVDLLTDEYAFEIERAPKWKESIGQALWYGLQTNKKPGIIILLTAKSDYKYFLQLNSALQYAGLSDAIEVMLFPSDFEHLINKASE